MLYRGVTIGGGFVVQSSGLWEGGSWYLDRVDAATLYRM